MSNWEPEWSLGHGWKFFSKALGRKFTRNEAIEFIGVIRSRQAETGITTLYRYRIRRSK